MLMFFVNYLCDSKFLHIIRLSVKVAFCCGNIYFVGIKDRRIPTTKYCH